jgi:subtilisin family serine protease
MHAYGASTASSRDEQYTSPADELRIAVTFRKPDGGPGPTKFAAPLSPASVKQFLPAPLDMDRAIYELARLGFRLTRRGQLSASMRGSRALFEKTFGTKLERVNVDTKHDYAFSSFYFPPDDAPWSPAADVVNLIDDAYIQWPHIYMGKAGGTRTRASARKRGEQKRPITTLSGQPSVKPPQVDYFHLNVPRDVPRVLNADRVHAKGTTGKGIRVVMIDSGFAHGGHPYFAAQGYTSSVDLAPGAVSDSTDPNGHGTGESANVFAVAPGATFIGVKVDNDTDPRAGASILEGVQTALAHKPHVISVSLGYDLRDLAGRQLAELPNSLAALEAEIEAAVAAGITVVFSAGNGHFSFPGMMPDLISAGGVFVAADGSMQASDYASAFDSKIYSGRHVPDFCGLVGMQPHAAYIMLPIPATCEIDRECAQPDDGNGDGTQVDDGWGVFSGTSAAAPQLAGVCALLLEKNDGLTPGDIKAILRRTARDVTVGHANPASSDDFRSPQPATSGDDGATGAGIVDALAAWNEA